MRINLKKPIAILLSALMLLTMMSVGFVVPAFAAETTVTFDPTGGSVSPTSKTVEVGGTYGELPTPTKSDYGFTGWYNTEPCYNGGNLQRLRQRYLPQRAA